MPGRTKEVVFEELVVGIDIANVVNADDMEGNADPINVSPPWAHGIEDVSVLGMGNGDQLGASNAIAIISGDAFPDAGDGHVIPLGGHGGTNIDLANEGAKATVLHDMGIRVKPGMPYTVQMMVNGDTQDEFGCALGLNFQDDEVREAKRWVSRNITLVAVDADLPTVDRFGAVLPNVPTGGSKMIGGIIGCGAGAMAQLGVFGLICKLTSGVVDPQSILIAGVGGELIIGSGSHISPVQKSNLAIQVKEDESVYTEMRGIFEAGFMDGVVSLGFVQAG